MVEWLSGSGRWWKNQRIVKRFAWYPKQVQGSRVFLSNYYDLQIITAFQLGGSGDTQVKNKGRFICFNHGRGKVSVSYRYLGSFLTISDLKQMLREQNLFTNRYKEERERKISFEKTKAFFANMGVKIC